MMFLTADEVFAIEQELLSPQNIRLAVMDRILPDLADLRLSRNLYERGRGSGKSGVYFLFYRWALLYVGKASSISSRLMTHYMNVLDRRTVVIPFNKAAWIEMPTSINADVELYYIRKHRPLFNVKTSR